MIRDYRFHSWKLPEPVHGVGFAGYVGGYIALLAWFKLVDVYHLHFGTEGALVSIYNASRVLFIFYLFWIVQTPGALALRWLAKSELGALERLALNFFAGAALWHIGLLALGYLGLYTIPVAIALTVPAVAASYPNACASLSTIRNAYLAWHRKSIPERVAAGAVLCAGGLLLMVKGLYPAGGHDYYTHYFYYFQTVIDRAGLWPNEVWYQYYYSKGAGLFFLAVLLSDPLAPQLVTYCFIAVAAVALFHLLRRIAPGTLWPWIGVILFLALYVYTPGPRSADRNQGGWGDFEKMHELNAAFVIAIIWMTTEALERAGRKAFVWVLGAALATAAAILVNTTAGIYLGGVFSLLCAFCLIIGTCRRGLVCFVLAIVAGATLASVFLLNFVTTGLINDQGLYYFWRFADVDKLNAWGALPLVLNLDWGYSGLRSAALSMSLGSAEFMAKSFRAELLFPLGAAGLFIAAIAACRTRGIRLPYYPTVVLGAAVIVFVVIALTAGRVQPVSFYRYSSFAFPITIACGILLYASAADATRWLGRVVRGWELPAVVTAGCLILATIYFPAGALTHVPLSAARFVMGRHSIDAAYVDQASWPGRLPWGGIYPGARGAYRAVGPHTRVWSFHFHTYCMLPDCRIESFPAFIMTPQWDRLMFGTPEEGRDVLQKAGLNDFLFSRELLSIDILPLSPLFAPDTIGRYLGLKWTDGTTALLTWSSGDTVPLDENWLVEYRRMVSESPAIQTFPIVAMRELYDRLRKTPHPWRPFDLPWRANRLD